MAPRLNEVISICAAICGAETWDQIAQYGESKYEWLKTFLQLPNGIPSMIHFVIFLLTWRRSISKSLP